MKCNGLKVWILETIAEHQNSHKSAQLNTRKKISGAQKWHIDTLKLPFSSQQQTLPLPFQTTIASYLLELGCTLRGFCDLLSRIHKKVNQLHTAAALREKNKTNALYLDCLKYALTGKQLLLGYEDSAYIKAECPQLSSKCSDICLHKINIHSLFKCHSLNCNFFHQKFWFFFFDAYRRNSFRKKG